MTIQTVVGRRKSFIYQKCRNKALFNFNTFWSFTVSAENSAVVLMQNLLCQLWMKLELENSSLSIFSPFVLSLGLECKQNYYYFYIIYWWLTNCTVYTRRMIRAFPILYKLPAVPFLVNLNKNPFVLLQENLISMTNIRVKRAL